MIDIGSISEVTSGDVALVHPVTKAPLGVTITIAGPEHPKRKAFVFDKQRRMRARFLKSGKPQMDDPADEAELEADVLAALTLGWAHLSVDGVEIVFSEQAAAKLYRETRFAWLRDQVKAALDDRELFIRGSVEP